MSFWSEVAAPDARGAGLDGRIGAGMDDDAAVVVESPGAGRELGGGCIDHDDTLPSLEAGDDILTDDSIPSSGSIHNLDTTDARIPDEDGSTALDESSSIPDDTPSVQGSIISSVPSEGQSLPSPRSRPSSLTPRKPFDRRFQSRLSPSPLSSPRPTSPFFLNSHSRQSSLASQFFPDTLVPDEPTSAPWDVIRWTKLRKLTGQIYTEMGRRNFGRPTCLAVSRSLVVGTSKGIILIFDYQQNAKGIIGPGTKAVECGPVTCLAISEDSTTIAAGHSEGHIFTWELGKSSKSFLHIPPLESRHMQSRRPDGHLSGVSIIHIGFLGFRHTALVSADDCGMAFSHLATRGMGSVARAVRTTRILGRYPDVIQRPNKATKASSVLAFSALPFGNVEQATNSLGLVAMMTPYLLVIVSTTPVAQTQHKAARPKEMAAHSALTAALAWFPAIKLKAPDTPVLKTKLVYCWSNVLTVLEISEVVPPDASEKEKPLEITFTARSRWRSTEAIVAVQWISRSVMAVLTLTQQLIILEDVSMNTTGSLDLVQRQIYHQDIFSQQLQALVEQLDAEDPSMHGVVADAFYMSFRAYKGRLFVLGHGDISIGSLSNWADRLLAMLEAGDFIGAIRLATSYYSGDGEKVTIGLPEEDGPRHVAVREKLDEMMMASLKYAFGQNQKAGSDKLDDSHLDNLAIACVNACLTTGAMDLLFEEVFAWYDDHEKVALLLDVLEPHIVNDNITSIPPVALKPLIEHYMTTHSPASLEDIICRLDTSSMDIDQITSLCKKHNLYDAYIYVWTNALKDYTGPVEELLNARQSSLPFNGHTNNADQAERNAEKIFPYLSFTLTGRIYPRGEHMDLELSQHAKSQIYGLFFSGSLAHETTKSSEKSLSRSFTLLRQLLIFDTASSMSVLNEAFEDSFLNRNDQLEDSLESGNTLTTDESKSTVFTRQLIVTILLELVTSEQSLSEGSVFVDMFVARSLAKYPQDIVLPGSTLDQVLRRLCDFHDDDLAEDCQLSVEYLLSAYHPPNLQSFVPLFQRARFYRVLKTVYRTEHQWFELVHIYLIDEENQGEIFEVIRSCLRKSSTVGENQQQRIRNLVQEQILHLTNIDVHRTAVLIADVMPESHESLLATMQGNSRLQYQYLETLLEPKIKSSLTSSLPSSLLQRYIQLICEHNPRHVADYISSIAEVDLQLQDVLPSMEATGTIDAVVILMTRQGQVDSAMDRLLEHLGSLDSALSGIMRNISASPDLASTLETIRDLISSAKKYSGVGIWLCQRQTKLINQTRQLPKAKRRSSSGPQPLTFEEQLWLRLVNMVVAIARHTALFELGDESASLSLDLNKEVVIPLRIIIQNVFTALLKSTTTTRELSRDRHDFSFLQILRAFLQQAAVSSPSLAELRDIIGAIFSAYAYEESLLSLSNTMLDKDVFVHVENVVRLRQQGWRPRGQICEICRRRVWGPGAGSQIWDAWVKREEQRISQPYVQKQLDDDADPRSSRVKGKGTADAASVESELLQAQPSGESRLNEPSLGPAVVFACRHLFHEFCLDHHAGKGSERALEGAQGHDIFEKVCPVCSGTF